MVARIRQQRSLRAVGFDEIRPVNRKHLLNLLKLALAALLIWYVLSRVDREKILKAIREIDILLFIAGASFYLIAASVSSVRWWWLLRVNDLRIGAWQALRLTWIGIFFNNVIPGLTGGDVVKAVYVARATGKKLRPVLSVLVDRVLGMIALALLAAICVLFRLDIEAFQVVAIGLWGGLVALVLGTTLFLSRRVRRLVGFDRLLRKLPGSGMLMQFDQAMTLYRGHLGGLFVWLFLSSLNHLVATFGVVLIGKALHGHLPTIDYLVLVPVANIFTAIPLAPAGWGIGEFAFKWLWENCGWTAVPSAVAQTKDAAKLVMATEGTTLSIVYRVHLMLWSLLGAVFLIFEKGKSVSADEVEHIFDDAESTQSG